VELGGLHIIGTERHESRRIDNQLRGRSGRQGDPGKSRFYIGLDDDLMRLFGGDRIAPMVERLGLEDDVPIEMGMLSKQIENAQKRVEGRNFDIRRHVLQYDDVMNAQREVIYGQRRQVLDGVDMHEQIHGMVEDTIEYIVGTYCNDHTISEEWDFKGLNENLNSVFGYPMGVFENLTEQQYMQLTVKKLTERLKGEIWAAYDRLEKQAVEAGVDMNEIERVVLLRVVDQKWMDHIDDMDQLRQGIGLRAYGHTDPVAAYKQEGSDMYDEMIANIRMDVVKTLYHARINKVPERKEAVKPVQTPDQVAEAQRTQAGKKTVQRSAAKVGRNDPCPCGSGKKYKQCCGKNA